MSKKYIYILDSIFFTLRKKNKKNLNANSMNFLCFVFGDRYIGKFYTLCLFRSQISNG